MTELDPKIFAASMLAEGLGDVTQNIARIQCSGDIPTIKAKLQRGMEFYSELARALNNILKAKAPEFAFKGDMNAQLRELCTLEKSKNSGNQPLLLKNKTMKGGMPGGPRGGAPTGQGDPRRQMIPYTGPNGGQGQIAVFNPEVVRREHGYEAGMLADFALRAAIEGNLAQAVRLTAKIDIVVRTHDMLERGLPLADITQHMAGGFGLGGIIGVALFYLGVSGLLLVPAGLTAGTAQYTANLAANATRAAASAATFGYVETNVAQPRAVDTAKAVANNLQQLLESVITDRAANSYIAIWMIVCMLAAALYARGLNLYIIPARARLEAELAAARTGVSDAVVHAIENRVRTQRNRNLAELGINADKESDAVFKNISDKLLEFHNDKVNLTKETPQQANTRRRKLALAKKVRDELRNERRKRGNGGGGGGP
jgi:hypothetical protein